MSIITELSQSRYYTSINPYLLPGLTLWLDAANTSSITTYPGAVSQWNDLSMKGNNATQPTAGNQPTSAAAIQNNLAAITCNQSLNNYLIIPNNTIPNLTTGSVTLFIAAKSNTNSFPIARFLVGSTNSPRFLIAANLTTGLLEATLGSTSPISLTSSFAALNDTKFICMITVDGVTNDCVFKVNNGTAISGNKDMPGSPTTVLLASRDATTGPFSCSIFEVIITSNVMSSYYEDKVWKYLSNKWAIPIA